MPNNKSQKKIHTYRPAEEPGPPLTKTWYQNTSIYMHLHDL